MILPNQLTILRIILSPVFLYLFLSDDQILIQISLVVFILAALSDWYDGWLARKFDYITEWGKFMDPLADKILTSSAFIGFALTGLLEWWMVIVIVFRDLSITVLRMFADKKGIVFTTSYYAKWKTLLQMVFLYYLLVVYVGSRTEQLIEQYPSLFPMLLDKWLIYFVMLAVTLITVHTGIIYVLKNHKAIKGLFSR